MTPEDVHNVAFSDPARAHRGYHQDEVDAFLNRVEATLRDPRATGGVTVAEVHDATFSKPPIGRRGYNEDEVDEFLSRVAVELARPTGQSAPGPRHVRHAEQSTASTALNSILAFCSEFTTHGAVTWRAPLVLGVLFVFLGFATHPAFLVVGLLMFIWSAFAFKWRNEG